MLFEHRGPAFLDRWTGKSQYFKDGFCVTGLVTDAASKSTSSCSAVAGNSHEFAWGIDILYTIVALALPFTGLCNTTPSAWLVVNAVIFAGVIVGHGYLHNTISSQSCNGQGDLQGYIVYVFALMAVDIFGFSCIPCMENGLLLALILSAVLTAVILFATNTEHPSISGFFMISQLVVSVTGLVVPNPMTVPPQLGWAFIFPCIVSLLEFTHCNFLVKYGGHSWYDFFLHLSMLVSLLFGEFIAPWANEKD